MRSTTPERLRDDADILAKDGYMGAAATARDAADEIERLEGILADIMQYDLSGILPAGLIKHPYPTGNLQSPKPPRRNRQHHRCPSGN